MEVNVEYANSALSAVCTYKEGRKRGAPQYRDGEFCQFELEDYDLTDVITSILHLAEQLKNEGEDVDPECVWRLVWDHFNREVLEPDDIEMGRRQMEAEDKKRGRPLTPREIFAKGAKAQKDMEE